MDKEEGFRMKVRELHKFMKIHHHLTNLRNIEQESGSKSLQKVARWLGEVVKPAAPTTGWKLYGEAQRWLRDSLEILRDHYRTTLEEIQIELGELRREEGERALEVAGRWMRRNLRNVRESTIQTAVEIIRGKWSQQEAEGDQQDLVEDCPDPGMEEGLGDSQEVRSVGTRMEGLSEHMEGQVVLVRELENK